MNTRLKNLLMALLLSSVGTLMAMAQSNVRVSGTVIDATMDEPFIGVTIQAVGTTKGTTTNLDGHFSIEVPVGTELRFSFVSYKPVSYTVKGAASDLRIEMYEDSQALEELVVIGYGASRKEDLSTSISTMSVGKELKSGTSNLSSIMQGRLPGVTIQNDGGDPLSGAELNIRGKGSRGGDAVLYVVDGVPGAPFNVEDVENITVLKDAASAAIYGASVGSGGVIVVTTKKGKSGRMNVQFNGSYSFKNATKLPSVTTAGQYAKVWNHLAETEGVQLPVVANVKAYPYGAIHRTDWMDEIFRTGSLQHYAVTLSGGSDKLRSILSFSYDKNEGILLNTYSEKFGGRLNVDYAITDWLDINQNVNIAYSNGQGGVWDQGHEGIIMDAAFYPTSATVYELDRNGNQVLDGYGQPVWGGTVPRYYADQGVSGYGMINNPVATLMRLRQNKPATTLFSTTALTIKPIRGLDIISRFSVGQDWLRDENFTPEVKEVGSRMKKNSRSIFSSLHSSWLWENTATYSTLLADVHHISAMAGYTMAYDNWRNHWVEKQEYPNEDPSKVRFENGTKFNVPPREGITEESMISGFGRISYSYDDRYFITGSVRNDLSSKLAPKNRSAVFPAISGSWKISSESFMEDVKAIDLLKIRGSWGQVGNVAMVDPYAYNVSMKQQKYGSVFGVNNDVYYGFYQDGLSNTDLRWETTESWGIGLDLGLFSKLSLTVDYFDKTTKDLIERVPIVPTMGVEREPLGNVGSVSNKGWEFTLAYNDRIGDVKFGVFGNLSLIKSEVLSLGGRDYIQDDVTVNSMQPVRSAVGVPWQSFYIYEVDGLFMSDDDVAAYTHTNSETGQTSPIQPNAKAGDLKFVDQNGDGVINDLDRKFFGSYLPKTTYSFGGNADWKGLDFSVMFQGIAGNKLYNAYKQMSMVGRGVGGNLNSLVLSSFNFDKNSGIPRLGIAKDDNGNYSIANSYFLEDGGYLRLKNLTIGYSLPKSAMEAMKLPNSSMRFYISGENLFTFTKYSGIDPEVGYYGIDAGRYPLARTFTLGLNLNF